MRALSSGVPRAYRDHRKPDARRYREYCAAKIARYGKLPADARPILREAGLATIELERLHELAEHAWAKNRRKDANRLRRAIRVTQAQLLAMERRLEELMSRSGDGKRDLAEDLRRQGA